MITDLELKLEGAGGIYHDCRFELTKLLNRPLSLSSPEAHETCAKIVIVAGRMQEALNLYHTTLATCEHSKP